MSSPLTSTITTVLTPLERIHVDGAARGTYTAIHRTSIDDAFHDLRFMNASALLISAARYDVSNSARLTTLVREFPGVPRFMLLADNRFSIPHVVRDLCRIGIEEIIDVRKESGWTKLRRLLMSARANDIQRIALAKLYDDLGGAPNDCWRFFELLFTHYPYIMSVHQLACQLHVLRGTLASRFTRLGLPPLKQYINTVHHIRAARLLENPGVSITTVAAVLDYSSSQAFHRNIQQAYGIPPVDFRATFTGLSLLEHFRATLIHPYLDHFRTFSPTTPIPRWIATHDAMKVPAELWKPIRQSQSTFLPKRSGARMSVERTQTRVRTRVRTLTRSPARSPTRLTTRRTSRPRSRSRSST